MPDWFVSNQNLSMCHLCLPVAERIMYKTLLYVYKSVKGLSPQYIQDRLTVRRRAEGAMRTHCSGSNNFVVPVSKKCAGDRAFSVIAPWLWNILPVGIKNAISQQSFKSILKDYLFPWLFSLCFLHFICCYNFHVVALCNRWKRRDINLIYYSSSVFHSGVCWTKYIWNWVSEKIAFEKFNSRGSVRTTIHYSNDKIRLKSEINPWKIISSHIHAVLLDKMDGIQWKSCPSASVTLKLRKLEICFFELSILG